MPLTQNLRKSITLPGRSSESMAKNQSLDSWPFRKLETPNLSRVWNHFQGARHPFSCRAASKCTGFVLSSWPQWLGSFICLFTLIIHKKMPWKVMQTVQEQRCTTLGDWVGLRDCFQYSSAFETAVSMLFETKWPRRRTPLVPILHWDPKSAACNECPGQISRKKYGVGCHLQMHTKSTSVYCKAVETIHFVWNVHLSNGTQGFSRIKSAELLPFRYLHHSPPVHSVQRAW